MMFLVSRELFLQIHNRCIITIGTSLIKDIIHKVMKRGLFIYIYMSVKHVTKDEPQVLGKRYDLSGRRIGSARKGQVMISDGKKVVSP